MFGASPDIQAAHRAQHTMRSTTSPASNIAAPAPTRPSARPAFKRSPATAGCGQRTRTQFRHIVRARQRQQTDTIGPQGEMARTRTQTQRRGGPGFFGRHENVFLYVPNLIGALLPLLRALPPPPPAAAATCRTATQPGARPTCTTSSPGYARVAAAIYAFGVALSDPAATVLAYFASFVCDELDGRFARKFGQSSTFGAGERRISGVPQPYSQKVEDC